MWNDFFYYSKSERRVILLLITLSMVTIALCIATEIWKKPEADPLSTAQSAAIDSFLLQVKERERTAYPLRSYSKSDEIEINLHDFDPNTADSITFRQLGLPAFIARNILRYRAKGGRFRTPEAFARIYGITTEQYEQLRPYIKIAEDVQPQEEYQKKDTLPALYFPPSPPKLAEGSTVLINTADTTLLKQVPGIGSGLASMIINYRERLGGFTQIEQLQEVSPHLDASINKWFKIEGEPFRKIEVNRHGLDRLRSHPYMNFYKAKVIMEYRRKRGPIKSIAQLSMFEEFTEKDIERLSPYLSFE